MTINKSQGQTFDKVGLYLPQEVFTHGQLYVALSRTRSKEGLKIDLENTYGQGYNRDGSAFTKNIVYQEIFS